MDAKLAVKYADSLAKKNSEALSFIPKSRLEQYANVGQLLLSMENNEPCGFVVFGNGYPTTKIYQACIQYDVRRRRHGLNLVAKVILEAQKRGCNSISLWCANDLDANTFWKDAGFTFSGQREGGKRRNRVHNLWVLPLNGIIL